MRIGRYRIERTLGTGGMGAVYLGIDERTGHRVAIKTIAKRADATPEARRRLRVEADAQARLHHEHIVAVHSLEEDHDGGELFIVMEYVDGRTLEDVLQTRPGSRMHWSEATAIMTKVLDALEFAHANGIIHRDVKPSNVLIGESVVKLADFGIVLLRNAPRETMLERVPGTLPYMAPEQFHAGGAIDHRSDIYSAGLVLYRMLGGRLPYEQDLAGVHARLLPLPDLRAAVPDLPPAIAEVVLIATQYEPHNRFQSANAFADALRKAAAGFVPLQTESARDDAPELQTLAQEPPIPPDAKTRRLRPESRHTRQRTVSFMVIGASLVVMFGLWRASHPPSPPTRVSSAKPVMNRTIEARAVLPAPSAAEPPRVVEVVRPAKSVPADPSPQRHDRESRTAAQTKRLLELHDARHQTEESLRRVGSLTGAKNFDAAHAELDRIAAIARKYEPELAQEQEEIRAARAAVVAAAVAERTRQKEAELERETWERRLREIEDYIDARAYAEAKNSAKRLADDANAPMEIAARARALLELAHEKIREGWRGTVLGPTTNNVQKPEKPPMN